MKKKLIYSLVFIVVVGGGKYVYDKHINHNFEEISEDKVYKSGVIPLDQISEYVEDYNLKSIIDLRFPGTEDLVNNPEIPAELIAEKNAIDNIEGVQYINLGTDQVPTQATIDKFLEIMDNQDNYPVLIHCHHGEGRAPLFSALYRIEYENWSNEDARAKTRLLLKGSSFDDGAPKGDFLMNYQPKRTR
ncbi:dual specificity protein phosphatase family protein [Flavobacteriaceae bacterium]|nr:dual specificity protein phosphatase family protein [Flavobacteriaceae bacterium]